MEEETGQTGSEESTQEEHQEAAQPTIEEIAKSIGYRDKSEMKDPSKHVDAATYIKNTAKFNDSYRQEIKNLKRSIDGITATVSQVAVQKHAEGIAQAKAELKAAKEAFDPDAVEQATIALQKIKDSAPKAEAQAPAEVDEWCERNSWFEADKGMKADALEYREKYIKANPDATISETLAYIEKKIRKDYPESFETKEAKPSAKAGPSAGPEGLGTVGGNSKEPWEKYEKELNKTERDTMNALCGMLHNGKAVITKKQYIDNLAASGRFGR
jgi:tetratricopeptide (TPR) repeat protein